MKRNFVFGIIIAVFALQQVFSQELLIGIKPHQLITAGNSFDFGTGGTSLELAYRQNLQTNLKWYAGIETGTSLWGTEFLANAGLVYCKSISGIWSWEVTAGLQQGIELFRPASLYTGGIISTIGIQAKISEKSSLAFNTGLRYVFCPAYAQYSYISTSLQIPFSLSYRLIL